MVENLLRLMTGTTRVIRHWLGLFVKGKVMKCSKNGLKSLGGETAIFAGVSCQLLELVPGKGVLGKFQQGHVGPPDTDY